MKYSIDLSDFHNGLQVRSEKIRKKLISEIMCHKPASYGVFFFSSLIPFRIIFVKMCKHVSTHFQTSSDVAL